MYSDSFSSWYNWTLPVFVGVVFWGRTQYIISEHQSMDSTVAICISRQEKSLLGNAPSLFLFSSIAIFILKDKVMVEMCSSSVNVPALHATVWYVSSVIWRSWMEYLLYRMECLLYIWTIYVPLTFYVGNGVSAWRGLTVTLKPIWGPTRREYGAVLSCRVGFSHSQCPSDGLRTPVGKDCLHCR